MAPDPREVRDGRFVRQPNAFTDPLEGEAGRYHLYVSSACPWAQRSLITRALKGLEDVISVGVVDPIRDERGWRFTPREQGGPGRDEVNGFTFLSEAYTATDPGYEGRVTVPCVWDRRTGRLVSNDFPEIPRQLNHVFDAVGGDPDVDLSPPDLRQEIDALDRRLYHDVNDGVYRAGFATDQDAYEEAYDGVFAALDDMEERLSARRYLTGDRLTLVDIHLWVTLIRFDPVYHGHFKCNRNRITDYPNLWGYTRDLYQQPAFRGTTDLDAIKRHYYRTHPRLNPTRIVPKGPVLDLEAAHGRDPRGGS